MIDLNEMSRAAFKTANKREEKGQLKSDTMSILKHCAGEVVEATQAHNDCYWNCCNFFREQIKKKEFKMRFANELADIITCALIAAANRRCGHRGGFASGAGEEQKEG